MGIKQGGFSLKDRRIFRYILSLLLISMIVLTACTEENLENQIETDNLRLISLSPSTTEILYELNLGDDIVGVTEFCNYPQDAMSKKKVGGYADYNLEEIIGLEPDVVFYSGNLKTEDREVLEKMEIKFFDFESKTVEDIFNEILEIGRLTRSEERAEEIVDNMKMGKKRIEDKVKGLKRPKVFYEIWHDPLQTAGRGSFIDDIIEIAGGENIARGLVNVENPYPMIQEEFLIEENPEFYLLGADTGMSLEEIKSRPGYNSIEAIKKSNIYFLDSDIILRPGPRVIEGIEIIAKTIYPEVFE